MSDPMHASDLLLEEEPTRFRPTQTQRLGARPMDEVIEKTVSEIVAAFGSKKKVQASVREPKK